MKLKNKNKGSTLVEMLVVLSVIAILSSISLAYYREGEKSVSLSRSAQKLAQDISNAKEMALTGQKFNNVFPMGGYGIYFVQNSNSYILFADSDGDKEYDELEKVEILFLEKNGKISNLSPSSPLNIVFFPPDPTVTIKPAAVSAIITISLNNKTKTITVNSVGSIDID